MSFSTGNRPRSLTPKKLHHNKMESTSLDASEIYTNATGTALIVRAVDGVGDTVVKVYSFPFAGTLHVSLNLLRDSCSSRKRRSGRHDV